MPTDTPPAASPNKPALRAMVATDPPLYATMNRAFPDALEPMQLTGSCKIDPTKSGAYVTPRDSGPYAGRALYLPDDVSWHITRDPEGYLCLIAYPKEA